MTDKTYTQSQIDDCIAKIRHLKDEAEYDGNNHEAGAYRQAVKIIKSTLKMPKLAHKEGTR